MKEPRRTTILVVVDNEDIRLALRDRLLSMGFDVMLESNWELALSRISMEASRSPIQGVLLDLQMPVVNRTAVLCELRDRHPEIPVVVMLGVNDTAQITEARQIGARTYLIKPCDCEQDWERLYWIFHDD